MAKKKTDAVDIDDIVLDDRCQTRVELNPEATAEYADIYREGEVELPALEVCNVDGKLTLIDGFHRLAAARQADQGFIRVTVVEQCDMGRAMWLASAANQECGVRRSNLDKRRAVELALKSEIGFEQSSRVLAEHVGVSHNLVAEIRREVEAAKVAADTADTDASVIGLQPGDTAAPSDQETPPEDTDEAPAPKSTEEPADDRAVDDRAVDIAGVASQLVESAKTFHKTAKRGHAKVELHAGDDFPDFVEVAADVFKNADEALVAAQAFAAGAAAAVKEESGLRKAS
jgi:hypothetical protein